MGAISAISRIEDDPSSASEGLFRPRLETLNGWVPLGLLALGVLEYLCYPIPPYARAYYQFTGILLFTGGHVGLTLVLLWRLPSGRAWIAKRTDRSPARFWRKCGWIFVASALLAAAALDLLSRLGIPTMLAATLFLWFDWVVGNHHAISQSHGLQMAYGRKGTSLLGPERDARTRRRAKWATRLLLLGILPGPIAWQYPVALYASSAVLSIATGLYLFACAPMIRASGRPGRMFALRFLLWPFANLSYFIGVGYRSLHGLEYMLVYDKLVGRDCPARARSRVDSYAWMAFAIATALTLFPVVVRDPPALNLLYPPEAYRDHWFKILASLNMGLTYTHYYLDRQIFRMSDSSSREIFGRLLTG